jgi:hypothetical protein
MVSPLQTVSSEALIMEVVARLRASVLMFPSVNNAATCFNTIGLYKSSLNRPLSQQQLQRFVDADFEILYERFLALALAADRILKEKETQLQLDISHKNV